MNTCQDCGSELDDYSPCGCLLSTDLRTPKPKAPNVFGGMRGMKQRSMAKKAERLNTEVSK